MMPLGAPSISKYGSLVRPDAQIVALRAHCTRTARALLPQKFQTALTNELEAFQTSNSSVTPTEIRDFQNMPHGPL